MFQISRGVAKVGAFVLVVATLGLASPMLPSAQATGTIPGPPTGIAVSGATTTSLNVSWAAPMSDGGSAITDYKVEFRKFNESTWSQFTHGVSTATSITVTGLSVDTQYEFRVSAVNTIGTGPYREQITAVASAGVSHACAVAVDRTVKCWGRNAYGQLGDNSTVTSWAPVQVANIDGSTPGKSAVSVNGSPSNFSPQTCTVMEDGTVWCWGKSDGGLGDGLSNQSSIPVKVSNIDGSSPATTAVSVDVGTNLACALMQNGAVKCWGTGIGTTATTMTDIDGTNVATKAVDLSVGSQHSCVALANGTVKCWGTNSSGQLGTDFWRRPTSATPLLIPVIDGSTAAKKAVRVSVSAEHSCALMENGTVNCWGSDHDGELGDNTIAGNGNPNPVAVLGIDGLDTATTAVSIAVGGSYHFGYSCALMANHTVKCWGNNVAGQIGNGERGYINGYIVRRAMSPESVFGLSGSTPETSVSTLSASESGACALLEDSTVVCWGTNTYGNLGNSSTNDSAVPVRVTFPYATGRTLASTSVPDAPHNVATSNVTATSVDLSWSPPGSDGGFAVTDYVIEYRQPSDSTWSDVAHSPSTNTSITISGLDPDSTYEFRVSAVSSAGTGPWQEMVKSLAGGVGYHFCAVMVDGAATCWGYNYYGQLGNGSTTSSVAAVPVTGIDGSSPATTAISVGGGKNHSCAVLANGTVKCWGQNDSGQLGDGTLTNSSVPVSVRVIDGVTPSTTAVNVSAGQTNSCAQMADGTVRCWGGGSDSQIVEGITALSDSTTAVDLDTDFFHSCVATRNGSAMCWGISGFGQLGKGTAAPSALPAVVSGIDGSSDAATAVEVALGENSSCARMGAGTVKCWGSNSSGQLGDGSKTQRNSPVSVSGITGVDDATTAVDVSAGGVHTCAVMANGTVKCWGAGFFGLLGDGLGTESLVPVAVSGLTGATPDTTAVAIGSSRFATCALMEDADVQCWGGTGFLDSNFSTVSLSPARVPLVYTQAHTLTIPAPDAPGAPTVVAGDGQATVTVVPAVGGTPPASYRISVAGDPSKFCTVTNPAVSLSCVVQNLTNGASYTFVVEASAYGLSSTPSSPSAPVTPMAPPNAPGVPTAVAGDGQVTVTVVPAVGGTPPTSYTIFVVGMPGKSCTVPNPSVPMSCPISGLTNGTAYKFIAVANANGVSSANSQQSAPVTPRPPAAVPPGKPLNVIISDRSAETLEVSWNAPTTSGTTAIVGYTVTWRESGKAWLAGNTKDVAGRTATLTGLTSGVTYEVRVRARNATLSGAWSLSATGIVPVQAPAPKNVTGVANGLKITLTWSLVKVPSHSPVLKYSAYCAVGLEEPAHAQTEPTGTTTVVTVTQHKLYVCRVTAVNAAGRGIPSAPIRVTVK